MNKYKDIIDVKPETAYLKRTNVWVAYQNYKKNIYILMSKTQVSMCAAHLRECRIFLSDGACNETSFMLR